MLHSIVISNYNEAEDLAKTLDSLFAQTFTSFEVVVVDDASTDTSREVIASYAAKDGRIRPFYQKKNAGVFPSINLGLRQIRGETVSFISSGEIRYPTFLEKAFASLAAYPQAKIWCCHLDLFHEGKQINSQDPSCFVTEKMQFFPPHEVCGAFRRSGFRMHGMAVVIDRDTFFSYEEGAYPLILGPSADFYVHHKIALTHGLLYYPEFLGSLSLHDSSFSRAIHLDRKKRNQNYFTLIDHLLRDDPETRKRFLTSGLFTSAADTLFWKLLAQPKYWPLLSHSKSSTSRRIFFSLLKKTGLVQSSRKGV